MLTKVLLLYLWIYMEPELLLEENLKNYLFHRL